LLNAAAMRQIDKGDRNGVARRLNNRAENEHSGASTVLRMQTPQLMQFP
jgi:hypothetical protein